MCMFIRIGWDQYFILSLSEDFTKHAAWALVETGATFDISVSHLALHWGGGTICELKKHYSYYNVRNDWSHVWAFGIVGVNTIMAREAGKGVKGI